MFQYLVFNLESVLVGLIVSIIVTILLFLCVQIWNKKHTPISIGILLLLSVVYFVLSASVVGMTRTKQELRDYQQTTEYKLVQKGTEMLSAFSPDLYEMISPIIGNDLTGEYIEQECEKITKYQWLTIILGILLLFLGGFAMNITSEKAQRTSRGSYRQHRSDGERSARSRHRSDY